MRKIVIHTIVFCFLSALVSACISHLIYKNKGVSTSYGTTGNGSLENAYHVDYKINNARYFSPLSYYLMGNAYVNSRVYHTLIDSYSECQKTCPGTKFRIMECSDKHGGKILIHRTHQNGLSVDFMVPLTKNGRQIKRFDHLGIYHYLMGFDSQGRLNSNKKISIDFETIGKHIIALDNNAKKHGLRVKKVIMRIDLKDDFYKTKSGKEVKRRGIYFAMNLPRSVDMVHDDHYHVDFEVIK